MKKRYLVLGLIIACNLLNASDKSIKLEESVITTENSTATLGDIPRNITVLTGSEIQERGAQNIAQALKMVSSVIVKEMGGTDATFDLRGQGATATSNVIVLVDGAPMNSIDLSGYKTSQIPIETIERIEVIPAGGSVLYGDGAIGGVINIITKSPQNRENYGSLGLELGSYGLFKETLAYGTAINDRFFIELDYLNRHKDGYRDYQKDNLESFNFRSKYRLDNGILNFKYNYSNNRFKAPGKLTSAEVDEDRTQSNIKAWRVDGRTERNNFVGDYTYEINSDLEFKLLGTYTHERYSSNGSNYKTDIGYIKPQLKYNYLENSYLVLGTDFYDGETIQGYGDKAKKESFGAYIINNYSWEKFVFSQGYRRQDIKYKSNKFGNKRFIENALELTGSYLYSDSGSTYLSYTQGFRTPNTDEINAWEGEYRPQRTETYELGIKDYINDVFISLSTFYIETKDEIYYGRNDGDTNRKNRNFDGITKRKGIELSLEEYIGKLTLTQSITYLNTEFKKGKEIPGIPKIKGVFNLNYKINENLVLNNSWEYYGKMYANSDENNEGKKVDDYILSNVVLTYFLNNTLTLNIGVNNIFNEKYYDYVGGVGTNTGYYPAPERNYFVGFKYNF